jgi:pimeloyl-ACP methyl ester carboxylesterase
MVPAPTDRAGGQPPSAGPPGIRDQTRARYPDLIGIVERDRGRIAYEVYGTGDPTIMFVPPWSIVHSRIWKTLIPDFARRHRVITWDARGNGRSDRPHDPAAHSDRAIAADLVAVLDATATGSAILVGVSSSAVPSVIVAREQADRVIAMVLICPAVRVGDRRAERAVPFDAVLDTEEGWAKQNIDYWRRDFTAYLEFFFGEALNESHSTKAVEDAVGYGHSTDPETLGATMRTDSVDADAFLDMCERVRCPVLVIQGDRDAITDVTQGVELARAIPGARLEILAGSGHIPNVRDPVRVNLLIRDFVQSLRRNEA